MLLLHYGMLNPAEAVTEFLRLSVWHDDWYWGILSFIKMLSLYSGLLLPSLLFLARHGMVGKSWIRCCAIYVLLPAVVGTGLLSVFLCEGEWAMASVLLPGWIGVYGYGRLAKNCRPQSGPAAWMFLGIGCLAFWVAGWWATSCGTTWGDGLGPYGAGYLPQAFSLVILSLFNLSASDRFIGGLFAILPLEVLPGHMRCLNDPYGPTPGHVAYVELFCYVLWIMAALHFYRAYRSSGKSKA